MTTQDHKHRLEWSDRTEQMLSGWCDISRCYTWLHDQSYRKYNKSNFWFSIPIIIFSTLSGAASVGLSQYVPEQYSSNAQLSIGLLNISIGIVSTLQNFFKFAQLSESHLNAATGWAKLSRNISIELSLSRHERKECDEFVKICRAEYDRLIEQSPILPDAILREMKNKYRKRKGMQLPDIFVKFQHTYVYQDREQKEIQLAVPSKRDSIIQISDPEIPPLPKLPVKDIIKKFENRPLPIYAAPTLPSPLKTESEETPTPEPFTPVRKRSSIFENIFSKIAKRDTQIQSSIESVNKELEDIVVIDKK